MAMNELLCVPYGMSFVAGSYALSNYINLANDRLGRTSRISDNGSSGHWFVVDLGVSKPVGLIALLATNANGASIYRYKVGDSVSALSGGFGSVSGMSSFPQVASAEGLKRLHRQAVGFVSPPVAGRYVRIETGTNLAALTAGRLVIGQPFTALDTMDIGYSFKVLDLGERRRATNSLDNSTIRGKVLEYNWTWSWMSEQEARGALLDVMAQGGTTRPILCVLNPDAADLHNVIGYGPLVEEGELRNVAGGDVANAYEARFRLESKLILNL